jgi:hypothetical protein
MFWQINTISENNQIKIKYWLPKANSLLVSIEYGNTVNGKWEPTDEETFEFDGADYDIYKEKLEVNQNSEITLFGLLEYKKVISSGSLIE